MDRNERILKEIKEHWFKDHKAELIDCGDITILNWRNPQSGSYAVRYVFDGHRMYITGDIGEAIFELTWKASIHSFNDLYLGYFLTKMTTCSNGRYEYDSEEAKNRIIKWKAELLESVEFKDEDEKEEFLETIDELISAADNSQDCNQWAWEYVNGEFNDFISEYDADYGEWIYSIGEVTPYHNVAYLVGLQMAAEQLKV